MLKVCRCFRLPARNKLRSGDFAHQAVNAMLPGVSGRGFTGGRGWAIGLLM